MKLIKNSIIPIVMLALITWLGKYIFIADGQIDWFKAWLVYGIPFGLPYMLFIIPIGGSINSNILLLLANIFVGAAFGIVIAFFAGIKAVFYFIFFVIKKVLHN